MHAALPIGATNDRLAVVWCSNMNAIIGKLADVQRFMLEADSTANTAYSVSNESYSWEGNVAWFDAQIAAGAEFYLVSDYVTGRLEDEVIYLLLEKKVEIHHHCEYCDVSRLVAIDSVEDGDVFCSVCKLVM